MCCIECSLTQPDVAVSSNSMRGSLGGSSFENNAKCHGKNIKMQPQISARIKYFNGVDSTVFICNTALMASDLSLAGTSHLALMLKR
jgi:hypothetical protein